LTVQSDWGRSERIPKKQKMGGLRMGQNKLREGRARNFRPVLEHDFARAE